VWFKYIREGTDFASVNEVIHINVTWWTHKPRNYTIMKCIRSVKPSRNIATTFINLKPLSPSHSRISNSIKSQAVNWLSSLGLSNSYYFWGPLSEVTAPADLTKTSQIFNHIQITFTKNTGKENIEIIYTGRKRFGRIYCYVRNR